jgi:hypothetical protein
VPEMKTLISAAHAINNSILPAEAATNEAAIFSAELLLTLLRQHAECRADASLGLTAIGHAARAASLAVEAREAQIRAHGALNIDLKKVGLEEMYSKGDELPPNGPGTGTLFTTGQARPLPAA